MRVLMISNDKKALEKESRVYKRLCAYAECAGSLDVLIYTTGEKEPPPPVKGLSIYAINARSRYSQPRKAYRIGKTLLRPDIITCQDPYDTGTAALWLSRYWNVPLEVQVHTDIASPYFKSQSLLNRLRAFLARAVLRNASRIRCVSRRVAEGVRRSFSPSGNLVVLPIYDPVPPRNAHGDSHLKGLLPNCQFAVLVVGRLAPERNIALAIEAFSALAARDKSAGLFIAGEGPERAHLSSVAERLGVLERTVFLGWQDAMDEIYRASDVLLNTANFEGYGLALLEAARTGLPIVTTDVGIAQELLGAHPECIAPVKDVQALSLALTRMRDDEAFRTSIKETLSRSVEKFETVDAQTYVQSICNGWRECVRAQKHA